ncbi:lipoprotein [uncultured Thiothrix sp.]|uniref:LPS translocon maturation chaperone LptM n=1 Tax=uncultured Thiothrix sp. TaxID=223185 RepID=UPI00260ABC64|nr:lipoprotein [uncultured Thiothrix sp.]HMT94118.1 lipoprotein [Thiolinea sp.]
MKPLISLSLGFCVLIGLSACGNKGPLYLPDQVAAKQSVVNADQAPQKQQIEKKQ